MVIVGASNIVGVIVHIHWGKAVKGLCEAHEHYHHTQHSLYNYCICKPNLHVLLPPYSACWKW